MMNSSSSATSFGAQAQDSYTDLASLNAIRDLGRDDKNLALEQVAKQFESMMTRMMMKSMRSANEVFAEGNFLSSHEGDMYQEMFDDQMALSLSQGRGLGIADVMVRQLKGRFGDVEKSGDVVELEEYLAKRRSNSPDMVGLVPTAAVTQSEATAAQFSFDGSSQQFIEQLYPMAEKAAKKLGVDPEVLLAQAGLETGWGAKLTSMGDQSSFNFFNIKADKRWQGSSITVPTLEIKNGVAVKEFAAFRAYQSPQQSFDDYVDFISTSPRYEKAFQAENSEQYIRELEDAGYATDPNYSEKIIRILKDSAMQAAADGKPTTQVAMAN